MKNLSKVLIETYDGQWDTFPSPTDTLEDYNNIIWKTATPPTVENLRDLGVFPTIADRKAAYDAQAYARNRAAEYPSIQEVTVALAEKTEGDSTMWDEITAKRAAIKTKYPKPE